MFVYNYYDIFPHLPRNKLIIVFQTEGWHANAKAQEFDHMVL